MHRAAAIAITCALVALASANLGAQAAGSVMLGAFVNPHGQPSEADVVTFEKRLGQKLAIDNTYQMFSWSNTAHQQWDIANGRIPMMSWSPGVGSGACVQLADVTAGKYDAQLAAQAAAVQSLPGQVWVRLFYEMTDSASEQCANPTKSAAVLIAAWQHVVDLFRNAGVTNAVWVWAPADALYEDGKWQEWYPGDSYVDILGADHYNKTSEHEPFGASICTVGPQIGKPFAITETGAGGLRNKLEWLGNVNATCPGLLAFIYWDSPGVMPYPLVSPLAYAALAAIGQ